MSVTQYLRAKARQFVEFIIPASSPPPDSGMNVVGHVIFNGAVDNPIKDFKISGNNILMNGMLVNRYSTTSNRPEVKKIKDVYPNFGTRRKKNSIFNIKETQVVDEDDNLYADIGLSGGLIKIPGAKLDCGAGI